MVIYSFSYILHQLQKLLSLTDRLSQECLYMVIYSFSYILHQLQKLLSLTDRLSQVVRMSLYGYI